MVYLMCPVITKLACTVPEQSFLICASQRTDKVSLGCQQTDLERGYVGQCVLTANAAKLDLNFCTRYPSRGTLSSTREILV